MTQKVIVGPETSLGEIERMEAERLQAARAELAPPQNLPAAPRQSSAQTLSEEECAKTERAQIDARLEEEIGLSLTQLLVLEELTKGKSVTAAARKAEVNAGSVHRWMRDHAGFIKHYEILKRNLRDGVRIRLEGLLDRAIDAVDDQITRGDGRLGLDFLREMKVTPKSNDSSNGQNDHEDAQTLGTLDRRQLNLPDEPGASEEETATNQGIIMKISS